MTDSYKVLGKVIGSKDIEQILYTAPINKTALVSNITVTNTNAEINETFDINFHKDPIPAQRQALFVGKEWDGSGYNVISTNGIDWTPKASPIWPSTLLVANDGNIIMANTSDDSNQVAISKDKGDTWILATPSPMSAMYAGAMSFDVSAPLTQNNYRYAVVGFDSSYGAPSLMQSTNGLTWVNTSVGWDGEVDSFVYGNGKYISYNWDGWNLKISEDEGYSWTWYDFPFDIYGFWNEPFMPPVSMIHKNNKFVAVGMGVILISTDGIIWSDWNLPTNGQSVAYEVVNGVDTYVVFGNQNDCWVSSGDLGVWNLIELPGSRWTDSYITSGNSENGVIFATAGDYGPAYYSTDGITWSASGTQFIEDWFLTYSANVPFTSENKNKLYSNISVSHNDFKVLEPGIICGPGESITVKGTSNLIFSVHGVEV